MYINHDERKAKIGKVSVSIDKRDTIRLRFTYPKGNRNEINLATNTEEGWLKALQVATIINSDIELGNFDETLAKYSPVKAQKLEIANRKPNLMHIGDRVGAMNPTIFELLIRRGLAKRVLPRRQYRHRQSHESLYLKPAKSIVCCPCGLRMTIARHIEWLIDPFFSCYFDFSRDKGIFSIYVCLKPFFRNLYCSCNSSQ